MEECGNTGTSFWREGLPKVCVPLTGQGVPALLSEMPGCLSPACRPYEWRLDCFFGDPLPTPFLRWCGELGGRPLLCTLRTQGEGGQARLSPEEYEQAHRPA